VIVRLGQLIDGVEGAEVAGGDPEIAEVRDDSRAVLPGDLFVAVRGETVDGHQYLRPAAERGAVAAVVEEALPFAGVRVLVPSTRAALGRIAANRFGRPAEALTMIGVTGTNGKTTTTFLVEGLARAAGGEPGVIGTVAYRWGGATRPAPFTTPAPLELHATLAEMKKAGCTHVTMECSSHALALGRLEGVRFRVAAFTNLTQDHLDFHQTMDAYRDAKALLFARHLVEGAGVAVVLIDREHGDHMARAARGRVVRVSARSDGDAEVRVTRAAHSLGGIDAAWETPVGAVALRSPLIGAFNLENLSVGVGIGVALGLPPDVITRGLASVRGVPGRLERVAEADARGFGVFVDYAHTPDALERVMAALRPLVAQRLIVVFGCGGDRDRTKRPKMGRAVAHDADLAIVTSDNPRTEEPQSILDMILEGVRAEPSPPLAVAELASARRGHVALVDRRQAIAAAIAAARPGDCVLIAGKGHEDYQIVGRTKHPFDDRVEARGALEKLAPADGRDQS
jgi:UDP-N-acetylmuramoyl-L-alanyl-D-glutamate--2,6-diaminopimelate ligase